VSGNKRLAIIDADSVLYAVALSAEMCAKGQGMNGEDMWFEVRTKEDCYQEVLERLDAKIEKVEAADGIICLSDQRTWRYDVLPTYKANRERTRRPPMMVHLRAQIQDRHPFRMVRLVKTLEADDLCGIASTSLPKLGFQPIVMSEDKDLLTIPGYLHQRGATVEVSLEEADRQHLYQSLTGDVVDNYKGLPGVGPKKADRILDAAKSQTVRDMWTAVVTAFTQHGFSPEDALVQARVARILRADEWDQNNKRAILWEPPKR